MTVNQQVAQAVAERGLSKVAHALRRSMALYAAIITLPEGTEDRELFARADTFASWLAGTAGRTEAADGGTPAEFLGKNPWE